MNSQNNQIGSMMNARRQRMDSMAQQRFNPNMPSQNPRARDPRARDPRARDPRARDPRARDPRARDPRARDPRVRDVRINENQPQDNKMRSDNDLDIIERSLKLEEENMMAAFDESYYLDNTRTSKEAPNEGIAVMNANGGVNEKINDNRKFDRSEMLKVKALDLESLIVERLTRDRLADAKRIFNVLEKMRRKYDDENVRDIYYRVLHSMPKEGTYPEEVYSHARDKNNFKDILNELSNNSNVKAYNEDNPCIKALGNMWEECDIDPYLYRKM